MPRPDLQFQPGQVQIKCFMQEQTFPLSLPALPERSHLLARCTCTEGSCIFGQKVVWLQGCRGCRPPGHPEHQCTAPIDRSLLSYRMPNTGKANAECTNTPPRYSVSEGLWSVLTSGHSPAVHWYCTQSECQHGC